MYSILSEFHRLLFPLKIQRFNAHFHSFHPNSMRISPWRIVSAASGKGMTSNQPFYREFHSTHETVSLENLTGIEGTAWIKPAGMREER
jgi:hypothetical protein